MCKMSYFVFLKNKCLIFVIFKNKNGEQNGQDLKKLRTLQPQIKLLVLIKKEMCVLQLYSGGWQLCDQDDILCRLNWIVWPNNVSGQDIHGSGNTKKKNQKRVKLFKELHEHNDQTLQ